MNSSATFRDDEKKGLFKRSGGAGGRRKVKKVSSKPVRRGTDGEEISVNGLGRFYNKVVNFSVVTRYLVYVAPVAILIAIPIVIFAVTNRDALFATTNVKVWLFWTWIEIVWLSIWVSKLVSKAVPWVFMFLCGVVSSGTRKYAMILKAVEIPLSLVGWAVTSLVTFTALTSARLNGAPTKPWVDIVKKLLGPALIASILYLIEKMMIQLISINYHRRSFEGRIKDSKRSVHLLGLLFEASRTLFPMYCPEFREEDYVISDSIELMLANTLGTPGHKRSGSATPMRFIGNIGRVGDKVTSVFGNIASEITGKQVFNPNSAHSVVVEALEKTRSSEALAKRLWMSFVVEGRESLYPEDIEEVLGPARKDEATEAFSALDNDANGDISLDEMIMKVVEIGRDRKAISASMRDVGQAIGVLDQVLVAILFIIVIFIFGKSMLYFLLLLLTNYSRFPRHKFRNNPRNSRNDPPISLFRLRSHNPRIPRLLYLPLRQTSLRRRRPSRYRRPNPRIPRRRTNLPPLHNIQTNRQHENGSSAQYRVEQPMDRKHHPLQSNERTTRHVHLLRHLSRRHRNLTV